MITIDNFSFFGKDALLDRLTNGVLDNGKEVVFVVGAPISAPVKNIAGVADVSAVTAMVKSHFKVGTSARNTLENLLSDSENKYQSAFEFLIGRRGQDLANCLVKKAVLGAHKTIDVDDFDDRLTGLGQSQIDSFDADIDGWNYSPALEALGELVASQPNRFGKTLLTSNFDPLIGNAIKKAGGISWKTLLYTDGDISQSEADGCQVIHIHGYWKGSDTLHTGNQLLQKRPQLKSSIQKMLVDKTVVVLAYGGWDDIFTGTLKELVTNHLEFPEVIWAFYSDTPQISEHLKSVLVSGFDRNRVTLYHGIDCHTFLPELLSEWKSLDMDALHSEGGVKKEVEEEKKFAKLDLKSLECDRPPAIQTWVGREDELNTLLTSTAAVVAITGIGGEGKSVLASHYLSLIDNLNANYTNWDWRDCREQGDRIRTQIISSVERLTNNAIEAGTLSQASDKDLIQIFIDVANSCSAIIVLDNVDHHVDFVEEKYIQFLNDLVKRFARQVSSSRLILTCRPSISYDISGFESIALKGLSLQETKELYSAKIPNVEMSDTEFEEVHQFTNGHAFWNDLLASQVARGKNRISNILEDFRRGRRQAPDIISSIWGTLPDREKTVLQVMSETVRPENQETLSRMVSGQLGYNKFSKAIRSLQALSLIVVKPEKNSPDLFDLHPLVRQFVRHNFNPTERSGYIRIVLSQYAVIISGIGKMLGVHLPRSLLERYSQKAELEIEDRQFDEAFSTLSSIESAMMGSGNIQEYVRVARRLFESIDWESLSQENKHFDSVFAAYVECLNFLEEYSTADDLLAMFEGIITKNTARYIEYCDIMSNTFRLRKNYPRSIEWGELGVKLKTDSNLDTNSDCSHNLALSRREGGSPSVSLEFFKKQHSLDELLDSKIIVAKNEGSLYGNVGRCLQLMGRLDDALVCYRKSALILESDNDRSRLINRVWAREWIGETLAEKQYDDLAYCFFKDALRILGSCAPAWKKEIEKSVSSLSPEEELGRLSANDIKKRVIAWFNQ